MRVLFFLFLLSLPIFGHAESANIGFVQGLWYSHEPVFVGVPTRVYVAFRNNTDADLTGTIVFTDNGKRIGTSDVNVLAGRIAEAWTDWTPKEGEHALSVTLVNALLHEVGEEPEKLDASGLVSEDRVTVDRDTDGDNVGDTTDTDDDNDGVSDEDETARGSDPLKPDPRSTSEASSSAPVRATPPQVAGPRQGLEQYLPDGALQGIVSEITDSVGGAKAGLDAYREARSGGNSHELSTTTFDNATITRTRSGGTGTILGGLVGGVGVLLKAFYTFALFLLSLLLSSPALIEFILLLGMLYFIYRLVRFFGRRPGF